nr:MAG TPA: hypothetical protein [Caudoviricetes sp.]
MSRLTQKPGTVYLCALCLKNAVGTRCTQKALFVRNTDSCFTMPPQKVCINSARKVYPLQPGNGVLIPRQYGKAL